MWKALQFFSVLVILLGGVMLLYSSTMLASSADASQKIAPIDLGKGTTATIDTPKDRQEGDGAKWMGVSVLLLAGGFAGLVTGFVKSRSPR